MVKLVQSRDPSNGTAASSRKVNYVTLLDCMGVELTWEHKMALIRNKEDDVPITTYREDDN